MAETIGSLGWVGRHAAPYVLDILMVSVPGIEEECVRAKGGRDFRASLEPVHGVCVGRQRVRDAAGVEP